MEHATRVFFPLDEQLGLQDPHYSEGVLKEMVWLSGGVDSFAEAESVFERIGHLTISDSSIWRRKETWGAVFKAIEDAEREQAHTLSRANEFRGRVLGSAQRIGLSLDGTLVHIRNEGWKELKVGCSFDLKVYPTWNKESQEWEDLAHAVNNRYPKDYKPIVLRISLCSPSGGSGGVRANAVGRSPAAGLGAGRRSRGGGRWGGLGVEPSAGALL